MDLNSIQVKMGNTTQILQLNDCLNSILYHDMRARYIEEVCTYIIYLLLFLGFILHVLRNETRFDIINFLLVQT